MLKKYLMAVMACCSLFAANAKGQQAPQRLKLGFSIAIDKITPELLQKANANGIEFIETSLKPYMDSIGNFLYPDEEVIRKVKAIRKIADDAHIQVWSIHMPAGKELDISFPDEAARQRVVEVQKKTVSFCALLAPRIILFHPSFFLGLNERELRKEQLIRSAIELNKAVKKIQATMVIENMFGPELLRDANRERPLMRTVEETVEIMNRLPADIYSAIDLNHIKYPEKLVYAMGKRLKTIHVADGTDKAENHFFPCSGKGHNDWPAIMKALDAVGYNGPFMYEAAYKDVTEFKSCYETLYQSLLPSTGK